MPTVLVTGANRGLGLELVRQYAAEGWRVHACCREPAAAAELNELARSSPDRLAVRGSESRARARGLASDRAAEQQAYREHSEVWRRRAGGKDPLSERSDLDDGLLRVHALDVADHAAVDALAGELRDTPIDVLIANAGVYAPETGARSDAGQTLGDMDYAFWAHAFRVNTMAPFKLARAFLEPLAASEQRKLVAISSRMGAISRTSGGYHAYRSTKAALNMVMASLARDLAPRGILVGVLSPGWVRTRMGGPQARLSPADSVAGLRHQIAALTPERSGAFVAHDGTPLDW